jgi:hypothetical protein
VLIAIGIPATILFRAVGFPLMRVCLVEGVPTALRAMADDPLLAISAVVVFVFLWAAALTTITHQSNPSDHRRGREVDTRSDENIENLLHRRRSAQSRIVDDVDDLQIGVRRERRFGSFNRMHDDDE